MLRLSLHPLPQCFSLQRGRAITLQSKWTQQYMSNAWNVAVTRSSDGCSFRMEKSHEISQHWERSLVHLETQIIVETHFSWKTFLSNSLAFGGIEVMCFRGLMPSLWSSGSYCFNHRFRTSIRTLKGPWMLRFRSDSMICVGSIRTTRFCQTLCMVWECH